MAQPPEYLIVAIQDLQRQQREARETIEQMKQEAKTIEEETVTEEKKLADLQEETQKLTDGNTTLQAEVDKLEQSITDVQTRTTAEVKRINDDCILASDEAVKAYVHSCEVRRTVTFDGLVFDLTDLRHALAARSSPPKVATLQLSGGVPTQTVNLLDPALPAASTAPSTSNALHTLAAGGVTWDVTTYLAFAAMYNRSVTLLLTVDDLKGTVKLDRTTAMTLPSMASICN